LIILQDTLGVFYVGWNIKYLIILQGTLGVFYIG